MNLPITPRRFPSDPQQWLQKIVSVVPTPRQLSHMELKYYNFVHFGMNTMLDCEWGDGKAPVEAFAPDALDTDQWCRVFRRSGSAGVILTAKHHDGFCLWDTKTTDYSVMHSPFGQDIVRLLSDSCKKYGLRFGLYLSPWDRHEPTYGTPAYNDFYVRQLTELATNYGDIFTFWLDGACGEGPNGKKQIYDFERFYEVVRRLRPNACISICGPDVRWIGNEGGHTRTSEWSVVPAELMEPQRVEEHSQHADDGGKSVEKPLQTDDDLGSRAFLKKFDRYLFSPAECDVSVDPGWFWHEDAYYRKDDPNGKSVRTGRELADIYMRTVGGNASLLLNVPPDKHGRINDREIEQLGAFRALLDEAFACPLSPAEVEIVRCDGERTREGATGALCEDGRRLTDEEQAILLSFKQKERFGLLSLEEDLRFGQRIENFEVYARTADGWEKVYTGETVGSGKFCKLSCETDALLINIICSRSAPTVKNIRTFRR